MSIVVRVTFESNVGPPGPGMIMKHNGYSVSSFMYRGRGTVLVSSVTYVIRVRVRVLVDTMYQYVISTLCTIAGLYSLVRRELQKQERMGGSSGSDAAPTETREAARSIDWN